MKVAKDKLDKLLSLYGFIPFLYLIEKSEELEDYELCSLLRDTLIRAKEERGIELPTKLSEKAMFIFSDAIQELGFTGDTILSNTPTYANIIEGEIKKEL